MNATTVDIRSLFQWEDPEVIQLAEGVFGKCILGKVHPPEGELKHQWIAPGGGYYGQWIWATIGSWIPLHAGIPTERQAKRMAEVYQTPHWQTPLPIPTVDRLHPLFQSGIWDAMWRGDVWPAPNYQVADGLAAYGYTELAADVADKTIANALKNGVNERYNALSGKGLGVDFLGMSGTIVTMMLDGLSKKHKLRVRAAD